MRTKRAAAALCFWLVAMPAGADVWPYGPAECNQLWFMRNLIMDRGGYCFGSPLGKSLFDNANCTGTDIALGPEQARQAKRIRELEAEIGCNVNTNARQLDVAQSSALRRLRDMPLPDNGAAGCSWVGPPYPIRDGRSAGSSVLAQMQSGDRVGFGWIGEDSWTVVAVQKGGLGGPVTLGWIDTRLVNVEKNCTDWAG